MEFEYKGGNCVVITSRKGTVVIDGKLSSVGLKDVQPKDAVEVATQVGFAGANGRVTVDMPGEYEVNDISILGIGATRMIDADNSQQATIFRLVLPGVTVAVVGHIAASLSDDQLESLGIIDVLIIPVGGGGYTLDAHNAVEIVHKIDPRVVIPTHYADKDISYEVPQDELEPFIKELGGAHEVTSRWKVKNGLMPEVQTVMELTRTS